MSSLHLPHVLLDYPVVAAAILVLFALYLWPDSDNPKRLSLPPGPKGLPFIGNAHQLGGYPWRKFDSLIKQFGPIVSLNVVGTPLILIGDAEVAKDILEKDGANTADRPISHIFYKYGSKEKMSIIAPDYDDQVKLSRRLLTEAMSILKTGASEPAHETQMRFCLKRILDQPDEWAKNLNIYTVAVLKSVVFGDLCEDGEQAFEAAENNQMFCDMVDDLVRPGATIADFLPVLDKLPLPRSWCAWRAAGDDVYRTSLETYSKLIEPVQKDLNLHGASAMNSVTKAIIDHPQAKNVKGGMEFLLGALWLAGRDTTHTTLRSFVLAWVKFPEAMVAARKQIDAVVPADRLPSFSDRANLPLVEALIKEVQRWRSITPNGLPHRSKKATVYGNFYIPKGSIIIGNTWTIDHDPKLHPDPEAFKPERHLNDDGTLKKLDNIFTFGYGRRVCPGQPMAERSLFIIIAGFLWAFDVSKARDEHGKEIDVDDLSYMDGLNPRAKPFPANWSVRDEVRAQTIRRALKTEVACVGLASM